MGGPKPNSRLLVQEQSRSERNLAKLEKRQAFFTVKYNLAEDLLHPGGASLSPSANYDVVIAEY